MNKTTITIMDKFRGCLIGMERAEARLGKDANSEITRSVIDALAESDSVDSFVERLPDVELFTPAAAVPVGLVFWNNLPLILDWTRADNFFVSSSKCAGVAAGVLVSNAMFGVPIGAWGNEVSSIIKGIDDDFVGLIDMAVRLGSTHEEGGFSALRSRSDSMSFIVVAALYSSIVSRGSYEIAVEVAAESPSMTLEVLALTGGLMGIIDSEGATDGYDGDKPWSGPISSLLERKHD